MPTRSPARNWVTAAAIAVGGVAMFGSAAALYEIGVTDQLAAPWTLPFTLDAMALVCVLAVVFAGVKAQWVRLGPWLGYGTSAVLQVTAALSLGTRPPITHVAALGSAVFLSELVISMWRTEDTEAAADVPEDVPAPARVPVPEPVPAVPVPALTSTNAGGQPVPAPARPPVPRTAPRKAPAAKTTGDTDLLASLSLYRDQGGDMTVRAVAAHLSVGKDRAGRLIKALEDTEDTRLVIVR